VGGVAEGKEGGEVSRLKSSFHIIIIITVLSARKALRELQDQSSDSCIKRTGNRWSLKYSYSKY